MPEMKIIGRKPVLEALAANLPIKKIYLAAGAEGKIIANIQATAAKRHIHFTVLNRFDLQRMAGQENHQGIMAVMDALPTLTLEALLEKISGKKNPALAILDGVEDPRNFGAILRVADGAGIDGVVIPQRRSASLTPGAIKTSAGAAFHIPVVEVTNLARAIDTLKDNRFWIIGTDLRGEKHPWDIDFKMPVAIILGSEEKGMRRLVRDKCDFLVKLPMHGKVQSLNVATAAAVLFYEIVRQRESSDKRNNNA
jgi:23S rRNA (guanosine2251-2'-O)-methyltransferase